ncbi:A24 family peptidase [Castellaniella sp. UC4442_H9]
MAFGDLRHRRLPNQLIVWYAAGFLMAFWLTGSSASVVKLHFSAAAVGFLVLFLLFALGVMGGGDVKLGTAVLLWSGPSLAFPTVAIIAWAGGILAVLGWLVDRKAYQRLTWKPARCVGHALSASRGVPYGVALACGGWFVVWQQYQSLGKI